MGVLRGRVMNEGMSDGRKMETVIIRRRLFVWVAPRQPALGWLMEETNKPMVCTAGRGANTGDAWGHN